MSNNKKKDS